MTLFSCLNNCVFVSGCYSADGSDRPNSCSEASKLDDPVHSGLPVLFLSYRDICYLLR